jgi:two-component sensor histidine kinase
MRHLTLNQSLFFAVLIALLPIAFISVTQGLVNRQYAQSLIEETLSTASLATAAVQREPFALAERRLQMLAKENAVINATPECAMRMARALGSQEMIVNIVRSDASGQVLCSVLPTAGQVTYADQSWWQVASKQKQFSVSLPVLGKISGRQVIIAALPVFTDSGEFNGMITAGIQISWMKSALQKTTLSPDALAAIAGEDGKIIVSDAPSTLSRVNLGASFSKADTIVDAAGTEWTYSSAPLYGRQLHVVYAEPRTKLSAFARNQFRTDLLLPILALLLTSVAVWIGVNRLVVRWLHELAQLAKQFARGNYTGDRAKFAGAPLEITSLSDDMHGMATAISQRSNELAEAAATTKMMAREVNHRVKNNLQMVMSLIGLQAAQVKDDQARLVLDQTRVRMGALALIHRLLYDHGDQAEQGLIDMGQILPELCAQLRTDAMIYGRDVDLSCTTESVVGPVDQAIPITLFIVEAVSNAYRHAFPDDRNGHIKVTLERAGQSITLTIADNGIGFERASSVGAMGTTLMDAFARQVNGELSTNSTPNFGAEITLVYPVS